MIEYEETSQTSEKIEEIEREEAKEKLKEVYFKIIKVLEKYIDMREEYYNLVALWIIGTYFHKDFQTYPYLFFNAMKGSGKTRTLKLIAALSHNGKVINSISEAVLFRTAKDRTFCIDELENIGKKEKATLRELLNSAYKKGISVERSYKISLKFEKQAVSGVEKYKIESFDVYCPIAMANIWGMEDVLADRCIVIILEKSMKPWITRLIEDFDINKDIEEIKRTFSEVCAMKLWKKIYNVSMWNDFILYIYNYYNYTNCINFFSVTTCTNYTFFDKIAKTSLDSRALELFFPLFYLADLCGNLKNTIEIAEKIAQDKKTEDIIENKDVSLIDFIASQQETADYVTIKDITDNFKEFLEVEEEDAKWLNRKWMGRALKRLNLIIDKRRLSRGVEVVLNYKKAKEKIKMFKETELEFG